jgi:N-acetylglucosaminyldiphosphoundecaprenol N-acetyl-beta-D-mannosaminyltransferase
MEIISVMGFNVFSGNLEEVTLEIGKVAILSTISPNSYGISTKDSLFKKALKEAKIAAKAAKAAKKASKSAK